MAVTLENLNPLQSVGIGSIGLVILIIVLAVMIVGMIGGGIFYYIRKKQLKYFIPLHKKVGNRVQRVAVYKAMDYKIGHAGDKIWFVPKLKKYIPMGVIQSAPNEFIHYERADGEWINVEYPDVDEVFKKMGVKYIQNDMRATRIAIGNILEQRFKGKQSFWEKYGALITQLIFYLVVCIAIVVIFYMFGKIVDKMDALFSKIIGYEDLKCAGNSIVPAFLMIFGGFKKWLIQ